MSAAASVCAVAPRLPAGRLALPVAVLNVARWPLTPRDAEDLLRQVRRRLALADPAPTAPVADRVAWADRVRSVPAGGRYCTAYRHPPLAQPFPREPADSDELLKSLLDISLCPARSTGSRVPAARGGRGGPRVLVARQADRCVDQPRGVRGQRPRCDFVEPTTRAALP